MVNELWRRDNNEVLSNENDRENGVEDTNPTRKVEETDCAGTRRTPRNNNSFEGRTGFGIFWDF